MKAIYFFAFLILIGCDQSNSFDTYDTSKDGNILINVDDLNFQKSIVIDSIFKIQKIVKLESQEDSFIGSYDKVSIEEDRIYIMDSSITFSIFVFDFSGNFLFKISSLGEGPDEYIELRDFTISPFSNTIDVLDFGGRKLLQFSKESGDFIKSERLKDGSYFRSIEKLKDGYVTSHANKCGLLEDCFNLSFLSDDLIVESNLLAINRFLKNYDFQGDPQFSRNGNRIFYKEVFNDTIYEVQADSKTLRTAFSIDFGENGLPDDFKYSSKNSSFMEALGYSMINKLTLGIKDFFVSERFLYFSYGIPSVKEVIIDLETNENMSFQRYTTSNLFYTGSFKAVYQDQFVKAISSEEIVSLVDKFYNTKDSLTTRNQYPDFYFLTKDINAGSNGIITFLTPDF